MPSLYDIAQDPAAENPLIALWLRQQAQQAQDPTQADRQLAAQGANVRSADISAAQSPIVQKLLGQGMTRGLSQDTTNPTNESGLTYSGPIAGYGGPTRASDTQPVHVQTAHNQKELEAILTQKELENLPGPGGNGKMKDVMDFLGAMRGAPKEIIQQGLESKYPSQFGISAALSGGGAGSDRIAQAAQVAKALERSGVPADIRDKLLTSRFPEVFPSTVKPLTNEQYSKLYRYNQQTGQLDIPQNPDISAEQAKREGFRSFGTKQLELFNKADSLDAPLADFKGVIDRMKDENPYAVAADKQLSSRGLSLLSPVSQPGIGVEFAKSAFNVTQMFDQLIAGARGAASPQLTQLRQEALPAILHSPELRDRLWTSFTNLVEGMKRANKISALGYDPDPALTKQLKQQAAELTKNVDRVRAGKNIEPPTPIEPATPNGGLEEYKRKLRGQ